MIALSNVNVYILSLSNAKVYTLEDGHIYYLINTLDNGVIRYGKVECSGAFAEAGKDKILALQTAWDELSKFQPNGKQSNAVHQIGADRNIVYAVKLHT